MFYLFTNTGFELGKYSSITDAEVAMESYEHQEDLFITVNPDPWAKEKKERKSC